MKSTKSLSIGTPGKTPFSFKARGQVSVQMPAPYMTGLTLLSATALFLFLYKKKPRNSCGEFAFTVVKLPEYCRRETIVKR